MTSLVALEDAPGLAFGVAAGAGVGVDRLRAWFAAQLRDGHAVQDCVDAAVAAAVEAVADRLAGAFGGRGDQRRAGVKAREACLGEAAGFADLDEQLGDRPRREAAELAARGLGGGGQPREPGGG